MLKDLFHLIFPNNCLACSNHLMKQEEVFCTKCEIDFPYTRIENLSDNVVNKIFYGRCDIEEAYSLVYFKKGGKTQNLLHQLKYNDKPQIGKRFGILMGNEIKKFSKQTYDALIPIPLHPKKEQKRGYNQALQIALGITESSSIVTKNNLLKRLHYNESQTSKNRFSRWENTTSIFSASDDIKQFSSVLIVDDVITTGSTIEACVNVIKTIHPECKVSVCSIGVAV